MTYGLNAVHLPRCGAPILSTCPWDNTCDAPAAYWCTEDEDGDLFFCHKHRGQCDRPLWEGPGPRGPHPKGAGAP